MSLSSATQLTIVKIAAGAVIIFSAVGIGVMTGWIPRATSTVTPPATTATAPAPATAPTPAPVAQAQPATPHPRVAERHEPRHVARASAPVRLARAEPVRRVCGNCGVVEEVIPYQVRGQSTGLGAVMGAIGGIIVGNQIGHGDGRVRAKVAGAAGGAYAGNQIEKNARAHAAYRVAVRMEDGRLRTIEQADAADLSPGMHVRILDGQVVRD